MVNENSCLPPTKYGNANLCLNKDLVHFWQNNGRHLRHLCVRHFKAKLWGNKRDNYKKRSKYFVIETSSEQLLQFCCCCNIVTFVCVLDIWFIWQVDFVSDLNWHPCTDQGKELYKLIPIPKTYSNYYFTASTFLPRKVYLNMIITFRLKIVGSTEHLIFQNKKAYKLPNTH